jgi:hypothetical protein
MMGFNYYLDKDILKDYKKMPLAERLKWLYSANEFRKHYPKEIIRRQEKLRGNRDY